MIKDLKLKTQPGGSGIFSFLKSSAGRASIALLSVILLGLVFNADGAFYKIGTHRDALRQASVFGILAEAYCVVRG